MILVVSGEGASDIGTCSNGQVTCRGEDFRAGPMAVIIDKLLEPLTHYSLLKSGAIEFVSEGQLKIAKTPRSTFRGKKRKGYETALNTKYFYHNARQLARIALAKAREYDCPVGAVLFRDADGTRSTEKGLYEHKWDSIEVGFQAEDFSYGVPMVPKPKSEAWLICALKENPYQQCAKLEDNLSGNDHNPNSAKKQLGAELNRLGCTVPDLVGMVDNNTINPLSIVMPSFNRFRRRLEDVTRAMLNSAKPGQREGGACRRHESQHRCVKH